MEFWIDIEDAFGNRQGEGPITTATNWAHTRQLDRAGSFSFNMLATDPRRSLVQVQRIARCWTIANGSLLEIGNGVIKTIEFVSGEPPTLQISGDDLLIELTYRSVGDLELWQDTTAHPAMVLWQLSGGAWEWLKSTTDLQVGDTTTGDNIDMGVDISEAIWYVLVRSSHQFDSITFILGSDKNTAIVQEAIVEYWNTEGETWEEVNIIDDTTRVWFTPIGPDNDGYGSFAQNGTISYDIPSGWGVVDGSTYAIRIHTLGNHFDLDIQDVSITYTEPTTTALNDIMALAPDGWSLDDLEGYTSIAAATEVGDELLTNPSFETHTGTVDDGTSDTFTGWNNVGVNDGLGNKIEATATASAGTFAVKITNTTVEPYIYQDIIVVAGKNYRLTFYSRGDGTKQSAYGIIDATNWDFLVRRQDTGVTGTTYTLTSVNFTTPAGCTTVRIVFYGPSTAGVCYYDDTSVKARLGGEVYMQMAGETVLEALIRLAEQVNEHFILSYSGGRRVLWLRDDERDALVQAVSYADPIAMEGNADACVIANIRETQHAYDLCSRVIPYGGGLGDTRVDLTHTTRTVPSGYVLDATNNYLERTAAQTAYGVRIDKRVDFADINPKDISDRQLEHASNQLFDITYQYLIQHSATSLDALTGDVPKHYQVTVAKADRIIWPGHKMATDYRLWLEGTKYINIVPTSPLWVLVSTTNVDSNGIRTVSLDAATIAIYPENDQGALAHGIRMVKAFRAHAQAEQGLTNVISGSPAYIGIRHGQVVMVRKA